MLRVNGKGTQSVKQELGAAMNLDGVPELDCGQGTILRCVRWYKHLGGLQAATINMELAARCSSSRGATSALTLRV